MSDLWVICSDWILSTTGKPSRVAAAAASSAELTSSPGTIGTPASSSSCRDFISDQAPLVDDWRLPAGSSGASRMLPRLFSQRTDLPTAATLWLSPGAA